jgi:NDP-sugar pyrophosphorylase family protein
MIVAAGLGTRLRPLSSLRPKPSVPVRGIPLVAYQLRLLARHGVRDVIINTHHLAEQLVAAAERWCPPGLALHFSHEPRLLDTGGGIRRVAAFLRESDPCLVLGGDMVLDADLGELVAWHRSRGCAVTLLLREDPRSARFGSIGVDAEGRIRRIASRFDLGNEARAGLYAWANVVSARAFDGMPQREVFSHLDHWLAPLLAAGADDVRGRLLGTAACVWEPVGTLAEYLAVNLTRLPLSYWDAEAAARDAGTVLGPDLVVGAGAILGPGARLRRAVVWDGEQVPAGLEAEGGVFAGGRFQPCDPPAEETPREARA